MKVSEVWETNTLLIKKLFPLELFDGPYLRAEAQQLYNWETAFNNYFGSMPDQVVTLSFNNEAEQTKFLCRFEQKRGFGDLYSLYLPMITSTVLVGYWGQTDTGYYAHIAPDMVEKGENNE